MYFTDKTDFLAHYGVMGMKWGHRKQKDLYKIIKKAGKTGNKDLINTYLNKNIDSNTKKRLSLIKNKLKSSNKKHDKAANKAMKKIEKEQNLDSNYKEDLRIIDKELGKNKDLTSLREMRNKALKEKMDTKKMLGKELLGRYGNRYVKVFDKNKKRYYAIKAKEYISFI